MGLCSSSPRSRPFGGDLRVLWAATPEVPNVLALCSTFLSRAPAAADHGLFRTPASRYVDARPAEPGVLETLKANPGYVARVKTIRLFRSFANGSRPGSIPWAAITDPLVVAGLFKLFFRQLDPPLLTYALHDKWCAAQHQPNELAFVVTMRSLFAALPRPNQRVLLHVLDLFRTLLAPRFARKNGLTVDNLAHEFGPLFLRPLRHGEGARARYRDRGAETDSSDSVRCLASMLRMREHIFKRRNEDEFVRLTQENARLRERQAAHDTVMQKMKVGDGTMHAVDCVCVCACVRVCV